MSGEITSPNSSSPHIEQKNKKKIIHALIREILEAIKYIVVNLVEM